MSGQTTLNLVSQLKESGEDFEFYPTTPEIVEAVYLDLADKDYTNRATYSLLDIGCGNGGFFAKFDALHDRAAQHNTDESYRPSPGKKQWFKVGISDKYGIEKSEILTNNLPDDIIVIGTDFFANTLIDKKVDVIFSNPPYSQYEEWAAKIINEAYAKNIYLVIPERWKCSAMISQALERRKFQAVTIGAFDFLDGERQARAKVDVVKITKKGRAEDDYYSRRDDNKNDPFETWFETEFRINLEEKEDDSYSAAKAKEKEFTEGIKAEVVQGRNLVQVLERLYQKEMADLLESYQKICSIDPALLKELGVAKDKIKEGLKSKIAGTKAKYWHELFDNLAEITDRLTSAKRKAMLEKLHENMHVDFTEGNAYAIVVWVIKNANKYFDEQLKEMFIRLTEPEYIKNYKSNQKTWQREQWRYLKKGEHDRYTLDYRIITSDYRSYHREESDLIKDVHTIANNLGFSYIGDVKSFKNNNVHFRFEKQFMKAFNIEAARLFGWIREAADIIKEFSDDCEIEPDDIARHYRSNHAITAKPNQLLIGSNL